MRESKFTLPLVLREFNYKFVYTVKSPPSIIYATAEAHCISLQLNYIFVFREYLNAHTYGIRDTAFRGAYSILTTTCI